MLLLTWIPIRCRLDQLSRYLSKYRHTVYWLNAYILIQISMNVIEILVPMSVLILMVPLHVHVTMDMS